MKVRELIEMLEGQDPDADVRIQKPAHDHWRSIIAAEIGGVEELTVKYSDYHRADVIADDDEWNSDQARPVVVIG